MTCYELIEELDLGDYGEEFTDSSMYSISNNETDYLRDLISEFADRKADIYTSDILEYLVNNYENVNDTINEFGWDGVGRDIIKAAQYAQVREVENDLFEHEADIAKKLAYDYILEKVDASWDVPEEIVDDIETVCSSGINKLTDLSSAVDAALNFYEESDEE